jgi:hypothetical protein
MGIAAYNRGSKLIRAQIDRELEGGKHTRRPEPCCCGGSYAGLWLHGHLHGRRRCVHRSILELEQGGSAPE